MPRFGRVTEAHDERTLDNMNVASSNVGHQKEAYTILIWWRTNGTSIYFGDRPALNNSNPGIGSIVLDAF
jgi:hypothetical protein